MKELEEVDISFPVYVKVTVDPVIRTMVDNCPSVRMITMMDARVMDAKSLLTLPTDGTAAGGYWKFAVL